MQSVTHEPIPQIIPINHDRMEMIHHARILVVDDMESSRLLLESMFREIGFRNITLASSGDEALRLIRARTFDLVLLDLYMPDISGLVVCQCVRDMHLMLSPTIILQTASTDAWHKIQAFEAGASDFISKPVDAHELIMRSIVHLERRFLQQHISHQRQRVMNELSAAVDIQYQLLPTSSKITQIASETGADIASHVQFSSELGGDLWGLKQLGTHLINFYTLDFSGHGLQSALNTFRIHAMLQKLPPTITSSALAVLSNQLYSVLPRGQYATMFYGMLNMATRTLTYSTAGAPTPLIVREDGTLLCLDGSGLPLGCIRECSYDKYTIQLQAGDKMLIFSDALMEQFTNINEHIVADIMRKPCTSAQSLVNAMLDKIHECADNLPLKDDLTLVAIKI